MTIHNVPEERDESSRVELSLTNSVESSRVESAVQYTTILLYYVLVVVATCTVLEYL
jgi:hypothetical protein